MSEAPKDKDQDKADQRRDDLAKRVLNTPPIHKSAKSPSDPKTGNGEKKPEKG